MFAAGELGFLELVEEKKAVFSRVFSSYEFCPKN